MNPQRGQGTCGHAHSEDYLTSGGDNRWPREGDSLMGPPQTGMFLRGFDMSPGFRKEV